jgi:TRIAD3 protein (E3 ubiquitin-protein ligase RNF216)
VVDYRHFGEGGDPNISNGRSCPLHEDVEARHVEEVQRAARATLDKVKADNPGLSDADLMIKVSEGVRRGEAGQRVHDVEGMARPRAGLEGDAAIARMHRIRELEHQLRARQEYVHPPFFHPLGAALIPFPAPPPNYLYGPPNPQAIQYPPHVIQQANQGQAMFYPPQHYYYPQYRHAHRPDQRF